MQKILYLVKMGMDYDQKTIDMEGSDIGNYRIRGTFHDKNNDLIFIEFGNAYEFKNKKPISKIKLRVDHQFNASNDWDENNSHIKIDYEALKTYNYTKQDILKYIHKTFGVKFDELQLIDTTITNYNYREIAGDEFQPDEKTIAQAQKINDYFYNYEKEVEKKKYPNFSIYYENDKLTILKHYNGFNDKIVIDDVYKFNFDYKVPVRGWKKISLYPIKIKGVIQYEKINTSYIYVIKWIHEKI